MSEKKVGPTDFRAEVAEECDKDGYPYVWPKVSEWVREYRGYRCDDCGVAYKSEGAALTVHHSNYNKADCRRDSLDVLCWPCHSLFHLPTSGMKSLRCPRCKGWYLGWAHLRRHARGVHNVA